MPDPYIHDVSFLFVSSTPSTDIVQKLNERSDNKNENATDFNFKV